MKTFRLFLFISILLGACIGSASAETGVRFDAVMMKDGVVVARPSVWTGFDQVVAVEVPELMRFVVEAGVPAKGRSMVKARFFYFDRGEWRPGWAPEGEMEITATPSFEHSFQEDRRYRIVLMPRLAKRPSGAR